MENFRYKNRRTSGKFGRGRGRGIGFRINKGKYVEQNNEKEDKKKNNVQRFLNKVEVGRDDGRFTVLGYEKKTKWVDNSNRGKVPSLIEAIKEVPVSNTISRIVSLQNRFYYYDPGFRREGKVGEDIWTINGLKFKLVKEDEFSVHQISDTINSLNLKVDNHSDDLDFISDRLPINLSKHIKLKRYRRIAPYAENIKDISMLIRSSFYNWDVKIPKVLNSVTDSINAIYVNENVDLTLYTMFVSCPSLISPIEHVNKLFCDSLVNLYLLFGRYSYNNRLETKFALSLAYDLRDDERFFDLFYKVCLDSYPIIGIVNAEGRDTKYVVIDQTGYGPKLIKPDLRVFMYAVDYILSDFKFSNLIEFAVVLRAYCCHTAMIFGDCHTKSVREDILNDESNYMLFQLFSMFEELSGGTATDFHGKKIIHTDWERRIKTTHLWDILGLSDNKEVRNDRYDLHSSWVTFITTILYYKPEVLNDILPSVGRVFANENWFRTCSWNAMATSMRSPFTQKDKKLIIKFVQINDSFNFDNYTTDVKQMIMEGKELNSELLRVDKSRILGIERYKRHTYLDLRTVAFPVACYKGKEFRLGKVYTVKLLPNLKGGDHIYELDKLFNISEDGKIVASTYDFNDHIEIKGSMSYPSIVAKETEENPLIIVDAEWGM